MREPFGKQHRKHSHALLKCASQYLYQIDWSVPSQFSGKTSLLLTSQILGLLVNTLAVDEMYRVLNRDNLTTPIQMQLSQKQKTFSQFFPALLESSLIFVCFEKKMTLAAFVFPKLRTLKTWLDKCLKSPVSENLSRSNMVNTAKHCWNLYHGTFITFIDYC